MSITSQELFYDGYDPKWILGRDKGPPVEPKAAAKQEPAKKDQPKGPQAPAPVELKVPFCCERCHENIKNAFTDLDGLESVKLDMILNKVTITGKVKPEECLRKAKKIVNRSELWPKKKEEEKKKGDTKEGGDGGKK